MPNYRRVTIPKGRYCFTLATQRRRPLLASPEHVELLRAAFRKVLANPVKHGYAARAADWPFSSFRRAVERGWYRMDWGSGDLADLSGFSPARLAAMEMETGE